MRTEPGREEDAQGMLETFVNETSGEWTGPPPYHGSYVYPVETTNGRELTFLSRVKQY